MLCSLAGSAAGRRVGEEAAAIAPGDIMRNIHFSERVRRGREFGALPREPHLDERVHTHWAAAGVIAGGVIRCEAARLVECLMDGS
jgi:hypothetical protein